MENPGAFRLSRKAEPLSNSEAENGRSRICTPVYALQSFEIVLADDIRRAPLNFVENLPEILPYNPKEK